MNMNSNANEGLTAEDDILYYANIITEINAKIEEYSNKNENMMVALCKKSKRDIINDKLKNSFTEDGQSYYDAVKAMLKNAKSQDANQNK